MIALTALHMAACQLELINVSSKSCMTEWFAELSVDLKQILTITKEILKLYEVWGTYKEDRTLHTILDTVPKAKPDVVNTTQQSGQNSSSQPSINWAWWLRSLFNYSVSPLVSLVTTLSSMSSNNRLHMFLGMVSVQTIQSARFLFHSTFNSKLPRDVRLKRWQLYFSIQNSAGTRDVRGGYILLAYISMLSILQNTTVTAWPANKHCQAAKSSTCPSASRPWIGWTYDRDVAHC